MFGFKRRENPVAEEVKKIFLNHMEIDEEGKYVAVDARRIELWGAADGESKIRLYGIKERDFFYDTEYNATKAIHKAEQAMKNIGRGIHMKSIEDSAACIIRAHIYYPVVIVFFENDEGELELAVYTPKALFSSLAINSALKKFDKALPDTIKRRLSKYSVHDVLHAYIFYIKNRIKGRNVLKEGNNEFSEIKDQKENEKKEKKLSKKQEAKRRADEKAAKKEAAARKALERAQKRLESISESEREDESDGYDVESEGYDPDNGVTEDEE